MLKVDDIRETRVYKEAQEEGRQEGRQEEQQRQVAEKMSILRKMAALKLAPEQIADLLSLDVELVRKELTGNNK